MVFFYILLKPLIVDTFYNRYILCFEHKFPSVQITTYIREARWPSGRASDSGSRGRGFNPHSGRRVVSLSKIHLPPKKVMVIPRMWWLRPDMTEKLLTGT